MDSTSYQIDFPSSSSTSHWNVFLSFRGEDTRRNFTGHLYSALDRAGIRTFMDDPELPRGEDVSSGLLKAIEESKVSVVVFSKNYAFSTWCLSELVKILECKRTNKQLVLPVFYKVHPSDVRYQIGSFAEAFAKHKERFVAEMDKVDLWRTGLIEAGNLSGYHIDENGHEATIIQDIVNKILLEVHPKYLNVSKHPVGLESRVKHITPLLSIGSDGVRRIGIYGMGGVGKTTTVKAVYNDIIDCFEGTCFIENVRELSKQHKGLVRLQKQLVRDILSTKEKISNVSEGISLIEQRLCSKKVLIVLDDVDHRSQLHSLAGEWNRFASGSRIIITTRDVGLLNQIGVDERYNVEGLDEDESLLLFSWHAFKKPVPLENYKKISKGIVHYAAGLPLALEVLGSHLYTRTMEEWRGSLRKLQQIPHDEIREKLIISFDVLPSGNLKDIFLDIACHFIGMDQVQVTKILDSCGFDSENEIIILVERCLLSITHKNKLRMHDLLRDMGRAIVSNKSLKEPEKHSRLWSCDDICNVLKKNKGTEAIQSIIPYKRELEKLSLDAKTFELMRLLRLLDISGVHLSGSFEHIFEELRWLRWKGCPLECLPTSFHPEKLVILDLECSKIKILWHGILFLRQLKILNLCYSRFLTTTPDFTGASCIEKLHLKGCEGLLELHPSIGNLRRLVDLDLTDCKNLKNLPNSICNLRKLERLYLDGCSNLEAFPEELGKIKSLKELHAGKTKLKEIPDSIFYMNNLITLSLPSLKRRALLLFSPSVKGFIPHSISGLCSLELLDLRDCYMLDRDIPDNIGSLSSLKELNLSGNYFCSLPSSLSQLSNLAFLSLARCENLQSIPELPPNLIALSTGDCAESLVTFMTPSKSSTPS